MTGEPTPAWGPTARYVLRAEHHVHALLRASADARRRVQVRYVVYAAIMVGTWVLLHGLGPMRGSDFFLLYAAAAFAVLAALRPVVVRRQAERLVVGRPDLDRPVEVRVAGGELVVEVENVARSA